MCKGEGGRSRGGEGGREGKYKKEITLNQPCLKSNAKGLNWIQKPQKPSYFYWTGSQVQAKVDVILHHLESAIHILLYHQPAFQALIFVMCKSYL